MGETKQLLNELYKDSWDVPEREVFIEVYSCFLSYEETIYLFDKFEIIDWIKDTSLLIGEYGDNQFKDIKSFLYSDPSGTLKNIVLRREWTLPKGTYAFLTSPKVASKSLPLEQLSSLLKLSFGDKLLFDKIIDGYINIDTGELICPSETFILPSIFFPWL